MKAAKGLVLKVLGWLLLLVGIVLMVAPGPGAMVVLLAMGVLATQYEWADRRLDRVKLWALQGAADSVRTVPRIVVSMLGVAWLIGLGVYWGIRPPAPGWWPLREGYWLVGGWATGATMIISAAVALGLLVYSMRKLRGADRADIEAQVTRSGASDGPGVTHAHDDGRPAESAAP